MTLCTMLQGFAILKREQEPYITKEIRKTYLRNTKKTFKNINLILLQGSLKKSRNLSLFMFISVTLIKKHIIFIFAILLFNLQE